MHTAQTAVPTFSSSHNIKKKKRKHKLNTNSGFFLNSQRLSRFWTRQIGRGATLHIITFCELCLHDRQLDQILLPEGLSRGPGRARYFCVPVRAGSTSPPLVRAGQAISPLPPVTLSFIYGRKKLIRWGMDLHPWAENSRSSLGTYSIALATSSSVASSTSRPRAAKASRAHSLTWRYSRGRKGTKKSIKWPDIRSLWAKPPGKEN